VKKIAVLPQSGGDSILRTSLCYQSFSKTMAQALILRAIWAERMYYYKR
jgi:hypothetical protein